ncbi:cytochrome c oxidase assembly factor 6 homolog [Paramormyrops kingsleyae]|uniref:cytochrome c oxidase assembly factor 6 homolog n=1 Tax=Paramormyrops kingsleyae TaxID=1676925 RepID=UPI003B971E27
MTAPNSAQRRACWAARDDLWKCLEENNENSAPCETLRRTFEDSCPAQWVKYFSRRRDFVKYKEKMQYDGFESSQQSSK